MLDLGFGRAHQKAALPHLNPCLLGHPLRPDQRLHGRRTVAGVAGVAGVDRQPAVFSTAVDRRDDTIRRPCTTCVVAVDETVAVIIDLIGTFAGVGTFSLRRTTGDAQRYCSDEAHAVHPPLHHTDTRAPNHPAPPLVYFVPETHRVVSTCCGGTWDTSHKLG